MGDIIARSPEEMLAEGWAALRARSEPLAAYPRFPDGDEGGPRPAGYREAFLAGAVGPWPGARAVVMGDQGGAWREICRRSRASGQAKPRADAAHAFRARASNGGGAGIGASRRETSGNWSGAVLNAAGPRFSAVCARWRVPDARPSASAPPPIPGPDPADPLTRRVSVWVGLDGHRAVAGSLPQVGTTTAECFKDGRRWVETYAWAQWWVRGQHFGEVEFQELEVRPGDQVACWLALHEPDRVVLCIRNETAERDETRRAGKTEDARLWRSGDKPDAGAAKAHAGMAMAAPVSGMAAVWAVERPMVMGRTDLYPLPDFGEVEFSDCIAGVGASGPPFDEVADLRDLRGARLIRMTDARASPTRSLRISEPLPVLETRSGLRVRYMG